MPAYLQAQARSLAQTWEAAQQGGAPADAPALYVALYHDMPDATSGLCAQEVSAADYARLSYTFTRPGDVVIFPAGAWGWISAYALVDAASAGNVWATFTVDPPQYLGDGVTSFGGSNLYLTMDIAS